MLTHIPPPLWPRLKLKLIWRPSGLKAEVFRCSGQRTVQALLPFCQFARQAWLAPILGDAGLQCIVPADASVAQDAAPNQNQSQPIQTKHQNNKRTGASKNRTTRQTKVKTQLEDEEGFATNVQTVPKVAGGASWTINVAASRNMSSFKLGD